MKILITGGSGALGQVITRDLLEAGHELTDYSLAPPVLPSMRSITGDITDMDGVRAACRGQDAVIHLAGIPGPGRAAPERIAQVNVVGTVNLLEAAVQAGIPKLIFASSMTAFGFGFSRYPFPPRYLPIDENHPAAPQDEYGISKLAAELYCRRYSDAFGIQTICLRLTSVCYLEREAAELAVRAAGFVRGWSVEQLWETRYKKSIELSDQEFPIPGPPSPYKNLWAYVDSRDAVQSFVRALACDGPRHQVFVINAADTLSLIPTPELLRRFYPQVSLREPLDGQAALVSCAQAGAILGYQPQYTWRKGNFEAWRITMVAG